MPRAIRFVRFLLLASLLAPLAAGAQTFRTYVASYGADTNPCTVAAPCRLLPAALNAVANGGEIWILDSANFNSGTVTIDKDVTIQAIPGQIGSIVAVANAAAAVISPGKSVALRNVSVIRSATNPGTNGISMTTGKLVVEHAVFQVPDNAAILIAGSGTVSVSDTVFRNSGGGIIAQDGASVQVTGCKFSNMYQAIFVSTQGAATLTQATIRDSDISQVSNVGVWASTAASPTAVSRITLAHSTITGATYAVVATSTSNMGTSVVSLANNEIAGNADAFYAEGTSAALESAGNNMVRNNVRVLTAPTVVPSM